MNFERVRLSTYLVEDNHGGREFVFQREGIFEIFLRFSI